MSQFCEASPCRDMGQGKKLTYCTTLKITIVVFKQTQRHVDVESGPHIQHIIISDKTTDFSQSRKTSYHI